MIPIFLQTRFDLVLAFHHLDKHREDRSLERIIAANERFARMHLCKYHQFVPVLLVLLFQGP